MIPLRGRLALVLPALLLVGLAALVVFVLARSGGDDPASPASTPTAAATASPTATPSPPTARISECPVDREICEFAVQAEAWVRAADAESLIADGSAWDNENDKRILKGSIENTLPSVDWPIRLAAIGCPRLEGATSCAEAFSLSFTTLSRRERTPPGTTTGIFVIGFARAAGKAPAVSGGASPDGDDRVTSTHGGVSLSCNLSGLPERTSAECINSEFFAVEIERPVVAGQPPECPALEVVCETAIETEAALRDRDYAAIAGPGGDAAALKTAIESVFGTETPRLFSVACPFGSVRAACTGPFAVAFTTLAPGDDWTIPGKIALVRFGWRADGPAFRDVVPVEGVGAREAAIRGGVDGDTCGLAGIVPGHPCPATAFVRYWSAAPFEPSGFPDLVVLSLRPAASPPANSTIYTASGPCWACDVPDESIQKHVVDAAGKVTTTTVLDATLPILAGWGMGQSAYAAPDGSLLAVTACQGGYCGALGSDKPVADWRVLWSRDGGETWSVAFSTRGEYLSISSITPAGLTVGVFDFDPVAETQSRHYAVLVGEPAREVIAPPGLGERPQLVLLGGARLAWVPLEGGHVVGGLRTLEGGPHPLDLPAGAQNPWFGAFPDGRTWAKWVDNSPKIGVFSAAGKLQALYAVADGFRPAAVTPSLGIDTLSPTAKDGSVPALLDLEAGTITPMGDPFGTVLPVRSRVLAYIPTR